MTQRVLNITLGLLLIVATLVVWGLEPDPNEPNSQFLPGMHYSVPPSAQSRSAVFIDGKTLQSPPPGTVARTYLPLEFAPDDAGRRKAGSTLSNPFTSDSAAALELGTRHYAVFCQPCHGVTGAGEGTVTKYGFPPPPSFGAPNVTALRDGELFHTITYGKGNMPSLASQVPRDERWMIILRVRDLQDKLSRSTK